MFQCKTLASGSTGNAIFIRTGDECYLIDAGLSMRRLDSLLKNLDTSVKELKGIFITHEHSDHVKALGMLAKHTEIPMYATLPTAREIYTVLNVKADTEQARAFQSAVRIITPQFHYPLGNLTIQAFDVPHDSAACVGYTVTDDNGTKLLGVSTDMGHITTKITESLTGCKSVIAESNHDPEMLENSSYPLFLKERIRSDYGHLSNPDCSRLISYLVKNGTQSITLFHLSEENNAPELAFNTTLSALNSIGAKENEDFVLRVADRYELTEVC